MTHTTRSNISKFTYSICLHVKDSVPGSLHYLVRHTLSPIYDMKLLCTRVLRSTIRKGAENPLDVTERPLSLDRDS
jgi:hypothetical protein